jgi:hypothetical protein
VDGNRSTAEDAEVRREFQWYDAETQGRRGGSM